MNINPLQLPATRTCSANQTVNRMYLIIDCETTGLPRNWIAPISDLSNWPRIVQVAWSRYDKMARYIESTSRLVRPEGFTIPSEAQRVHGITTTRARAEGKMLMTVLKELSAAAEKSEIIVAHNMRFDESVISAEYLRLGLDPPFGDKKRICTMVETTEFCRLRGSYGYKWPTLSELHWKLFNSEYEEAHDAEADVAACAKCFFELKTRRVLSLGRRRA
jgi:DNA polymerase III epsilon subunit-like protein